MAIRQRVPYVLFGAIVAALLYLTFNPYQARAVNDWYCSPSGSGTTCSIGSPCSMHTLMTGGMSGEAAGDRFWARGGTYHTNATTQRYIWTWDCTEANPCVFRNYANEHAIIDCNFDLTTAGDNEMCFGGTTNGHGKWVTFWGFDITNSSTEARQEQPGTGNYGPLTENEPYLLGQGGKYINNFISVQENGLQVGDASSSFGPEGKHMIYGNYFYDIGYQGATRSHGHAFYIHNPKAGSGTYRSYAIGNVGLRSWDIIWQNYTEGGQVSYITMQDNVMAASGHGVSPNLSWPTKGNQPNIYLGANGGVGTSCTDDKMTVGSVYDNNWDWGFGGMNVGGSKGACNVTLSNNRMLHSGGVVTFGGTQVQMPPVNITGNYFYGTPDGSHGSGAYSDMIPFTAANFPTNTYAASIPTTGADVFKYLPNAYESGRGWVAVWNPDSSANVTIDPSLMGCYTGEQIRIFNWQNNNPWDSTPIATQTGCSSLSVSATIASADITPIGMTFDGSTPFNKPPDLGPQFVVYFMYPDWTVATTPTPTNTNTPSRTPTFTPSLTSSPTFTPTKTPTPSQTPTVSVTPSQSPTASPTFTVTASVTPTFTATVTPSVTPTPNGTFASTSFDVQECALTAPMANTADATVYGGAYTSSPTGDVTLPVTGSTSGKAVCTFSVPTAGTYRAWVRVNVADSTHDSTYVLIDSETVTTTSTHAFDMGEAFGCPNASLPDEYDQWWSAGWTWVTLKDRTNNCKGTTATPGYERADTSGAGGGFVLTAGQHTMTFIGREADALLDYVIVTSDFGFQPNDNVLTPKPTPLPLGHPHQCNGVTKFHYHPYSGAHRHVPCPWTR